MGASGSIRLAGLVAGASDPHRGGDASETGPKHGAVLIAGPPGSIRSHPLTNGAGLGSDLNPRGQSGATWGHSGFSPVKINGPDPVLLCSLSLTLPCPPLCHCLAPVQRGPGTFLPPSSAPPLLTQSGFLPQSLPSPCSAGIMQAKGCFLLPPAPSPAWHTTPGLLPSAPAPWQNATASERQRLGQPYPAACILGGGIAGGPDTRGSVTALNAMQQGGRF